MYTVRPVHQFLVRVQLFFVRIGTRNARRGVFTRVQCQADADDRPKTLTFVQCGILWRINRKINTCSGRADAVDMLTCVQIDTHICSRRRFWPENRDVFTFVQGGFFVRRAYT